MAESLRSKIEAEIHERGPIPFSRYMDMCLYHAELGYYSRNAEQFGKAGDFYTSSDVHAVFGRLLARQFDEIWRALGSPAPITVLELGPGRGLFAQDVLDWSEKKFPDFFRALHYALVENSPALRERMQSTLGRHMAAGKASFCEQPGQELSPAPKGQQSAAQGVSAGLEKQVSQGSGTASFCEQPGQELLPAPKGQQSAAQGVSPGLQKQVGQALKGRKNTLASPIIIFANEFFDALPVDIISTQGLLHVACEHGHFFETWSAAPAEHLEFADRYSVHPGPGERIEIPLLAHRYMGELTATIDRGFVIVVDYGYTRDEQLAGRHRDTLTAFRRHSVSPNPYEAPGEQDITAHVNFTALAAAAQQNGMQVHPLLTQSEFLMGIGEANQFADAFEDTRLPQERAKVALQLKHLVTPAGMGESFHVMIASKGLGAEMVDHLSGLSFAKSRL